MVKQNRKLFRRKVGACMVTVFFICQVLLLGLIVNIPINVEGVEFTNKLPVNIGAPDGDSQTEPDIAVDQNGRIHAVWQDDRNGDWDIYYSWSDNYGVTWSNPNNINEINLIRNPFDQIHPKIALDSNGEVFVTWQDYRHGVDSPHIYYATSSDGWLTNRIVNILISGQFEWWPDLCIDNNNFIHFIYTRRTNNFIQAHIIYRTWDGTQWSSEISISDNNLNKNAATIELSKVGSIHVAWVDLIGGGGGNIYYDWSLDGINWGIDTKVSDVSGAQYPSIVIDSNLVPHIIWPRTTNYELRYDYYNNGQWHNDIILPVSAFWSSPPKITIDTNDYLHIVYTHYLSDFWQLNYIFSTDYGSTWSQPDDVTGGYTSVQPIEHYPSIAIAPGNVVCVAWRDQEDEGINLGDIYFAHAVGDWLTSYNLIDENPPFGTNPDIAVDSSDNIHVVWSEERGGNADIYHSVSFDNGITWTVRTKINDDTSIEPQVDPSLKIIEDIIYVVWSDHRYGDWDIYFSKSTDGGASWTVNERVNDDNYENGIDQLEPDIDISYWFVQPIVHVVWQDERNNGVNDMFEIYYASSWNGNPFGINIKLSDLSPGTNLEQSPSISFASYTYGVDYHHHLFVVWEDYRNGNFDIYSTSSATNGQSWGYDVKISNDPGSFAQLNPKVSQYSEIMYPVPQIVWEDNRDGNWDIYQAEFDEWHHTGWTEVGKIPNSIGADRFDPDIVLDSGGSHAIWSEYESSSPPKILYSRWDGASWSTPASQVSDITNPNAANVKASICMNTVRDKIYVVWMTNRNQYPFYSWEKWFSSDIYFDWSNVNPVAFSTDSIVSWLPSQQKPALSIVENNHFFTVWQDLRSGNWDIYYTDTILDNFGQPMTNPINLPAFLADDFNQKDPAIAIDPINSNIVHMVWSDDRNGPESIYYSFFTFSSGQWSPVERINPLSTDREITPDIAVYNNNIHVAWAENVGGSNWEIYYATSIFGGPPGWTINLVCSNNLDQESPATAIDGSSGIVHIVWSEENIVSPNRDIAYSNSIDWNTKEIINTVLGIHVTPDIAVCLNPVSPIRVVWSGDVTQTGDYDIYYGSGQPGFWINNIVDDTTQIMSNPSIALDNLDKAYVTWSDNRNGDWDIYHRHQDTPSTWGTVEKVNDDIGTWDQTYPVLAFDNNNKEYIVWQDARKSINTVNDDIYFSSCQR